MLLAHELGHLIAARWFGVQVKKIAVGFGPDLCGFTDHRGTRWSMALLPFGARLELNDAGSVCVDGAPRASAKAFSCAPLGSRAMICASGPLLSLLLGLGFYGLVFMISGQLPPTVSLSATPGPETIFLLGSFSLMVGCFNLIPLPPLDGGWLALFAIEALTGRAPSKRATKAAAVIGLSAVAAAEAALILLLASRLINL